MADQNTYDHLSSNSAELFVGRRADLDLLNSWGKEGKSPLFIIGNAGVGKTTLAYTYAHFSKEFYKKQMNIEARQLESPDALLPLVDRMINGLSNAPVLVIIDGLDEIPAVETNVSKLIFSVYNSPKNIRWLITSRTYLFHHSFSSNEIIRSYSPRFLHLSGFNQQEVEELITKRLKSASQSNNIVSDFLRREAWSRLHGNPKLINLALELNANDLDKVTLTLKDVINENFTNIFLMFQEGHISALPTSQFPLQKIITPSNEILTAFPYVYLSKVNSFWRSQLDDFERLLNDKDSKESHFQNFFEQNPEVLMGLQYDRIIAQPILERIPDEGNLIPDFFLAPIGRSNADILDLKLPKEKLIVGKKDRKRWSSSIHEAIAQIREYRDFFEDPIRREKVRKRYGLTAYRPKAIVVIGRDTPEISEERFKQIEETTPNFVKITTYDQLLLQMKRFVDYQSI